MYTISINSYPQHKNLTFLIIVPSKNIYQVGEKYIFQEWSNKEFLGIKHLISKETYPANELPDFSTYLAKDCDSKLFFRIIKNQFKTRNDKGELFSFVNKETPLDVLVFTDKSCIKSLNKEKPIVYDGMGSLLSKKPLLTPKYCHTSKWNFEQQRPYTNDELKALDKI